MVDLLKIKFDAYGIPIGQGIDETVRNRARKLAQKRPDFYRVESNSILWCQTADNSIFDLIYDWVLYNKGNEPA